MEKMVFKAKLVALSLGGGWKHVMTMISHLLLQAFRCNTKRCLGLCSIVSGGGVGVSTATAVCATRTEMRRMDGQADLLRVSQRISVSCTPPPPCATSLETRLTEGCLLHSSLTSTAAQSFSFSETLETSLWRQNSKNTQQPHCHGSSSSCETGEALLSAEMRVSFPQTHRS